MKRIARQSTQNQSAADVLAGYEELIGILKRHLPPSTATLFAKPKAVEGDVIEWYSDLGGQPLPITQLPAREAAEVRHLLGERLAAVERLATQLEGQGADGQRQASLLRQAARYPSDSNLFSLNGQPVLTFWGGGQRPAAIIPGPSVAAAEGAGAGAGAGANAAIAGRSPRRWWPWLLLLLLLLALLAALWWWLFCREKPVEVTPPVVPPQVEEPKQVQPTPEPAIEPKPAPEPAIEPKPEPKPELVPQPEPKPAPPPPPPPPKPIPPPKPDPVEELAKRVDKAGSNCSTLQGMLTQEPLLKSNPALKARVTEQLKVHCKEQMIANAKNLCPDERPKELAPELLIVFDASGSMDISLLATDQDLERAGVEQKMDSFTRLLTGSADTRARDYVLREPKRITAAKQATSAVVRQLPSDINVGLVLVEDCPQARSVGYFSPGQRANLLSRIAAIHPVESTPLADGIAKAGQMLDGVNRESIMLVVSDGVESCGRDPCSVARALASSKPHLKINVIDILGTGAGNCLAQLTGGKVFTANNVNELSSMTSRAAKDVMVPEHCKH
jgi:hypothetical protein